MDAAKNFAKGTLSTGYDDEATSIVLITGDGARFPAVPFNAVWWNATDYPDPADDPAVEVIRVTARSTDTLTVTRAQESTGAMTHELEGKTYRLIAPLTARVINQQMLDVTNTDGDYEITGESFSFGATVGMFSASGTTGIRLLGSPMVIGIESGVAGLGDLDVNDTGVAIRVDNNDATIKMTGQLATDQSASATTPGSVVAKIPIRDLAGDLIGYLPVYGSIT